MTRHQDGISVLFASTGSLPEGAPDQLRPWGWVYGRSDAALECADLDSIHYLPVAPGDGEEHSFWVFAKRNLLGYHGGFRHNIRHFIREMEFRFNHRGRGDACTALRAALERAHITDGR